MVSNWSSALVDVLGQSGRRSWYWTIEIGLGLLNRYVTSSDDSVDFRVRESFANASLGLEYTRLLYLFHNLDYITLSKIIEVLEIESTFRALPCLRDVFLQVTHRF